jgi:hypothetical protein
LPQLTKRVKTRPKNIEEDKKSHFQSAPRFISAGFANGINSLDSMPT